MNFLGIDLAASPKFTGVVRLSSSDDRQWRAEELPASGDDGLVEAARSVSVIGVDSPLGWPAAFVNAVSRHNTFETWPGLPDRSNLTHRETDRFVQSCGNRLPLSVSADKLGSVAMRCALLQQRWADEVWGMAQPRDGSAALVEAYPASAFVAWDLDGTGYKSAIRPDDAARVRSSMIKTITETVSSWLMIDERLASRCVESDHVLDALACALVAVAATTGRTHRPDIEQHRFALVEGWIHIPSVPLAQTTPKSGDWTQ